MSLSAGRGPAGPWGEQGTLSGLSSQALLEGKGSGGQPGQHSQSISSKQGKLIPGPRMLLLGANTTLQLKPDTAVQSLRSWALRGRDQHRQAGSGRGTGRTSLLPMKREVDAQTGKLPDLGRREQQLCSGGGMQSMGTAQPLQH